jgi:hypothetical protein
VVIERTGGFIEEQNSGATRDGTASDPAYKSAPIKALTVSNCTFVNADKDNLMQNVESVKTTNVTVNGKSL